MLTLRQELQQIAVTCIGCGCDDLHPCIVDGKPCSWAAIDEGAAAGICTACVLLPIDILMQRFEEREAAPRVIA